MTPALRRRAAGAAVIGVVVVSALTSCLPDEPASHVYGRLHGGDVQVAVCSDIDITRITVAVAKPAGQNYRTVWRADGSIHLPSGQVLTVGSVPTGMSSPDGMPALTASKEKIQVTFYGGPSIEIRERGVFGAGVLLRDAWVDQAGETSGENPCPS